MAVQDSLVNQRMQAAGYGAQTSAQQMAQMGMGTEMMVNQLASEWGMNYAQKDALRKQLMGLGAYNITGPQDYLSQMFNPNFSPMNAGILQF